MKGLQSYEKENKFKNWTKQSDNINHWEKSHNTRFSLFR